MRVRTSTKVPFSFVPGPFLGQIVLSGRNILPSHFKIHPCKCELEPKHKSTCFWPLTSKCDLDLSATDLILSCNFPSSLACRAFLPQSFQNPFVQMWVRTRTSTKLHVLFTFYLQVGTRTRADSPTVRLTNLLLDDVTSWQLTLRQRLVQRKHACSPVKMRYLNGRLGLW